MSSDYDLAEPRFRDDGLRISILLLKYLCLLVIPDPLLPEWVPNAHPLIVHFPIALLFIAVAADAVALWLGRRWRTGREVATGLWVATGLSAVVTYYSGMWAADTMAITTSRTAGTLSTHATWGWYTMLATGGYALVRTVALFVPAVRMRRGVHIAFCVVGLGAFFPLWKVGENGGRWCTSTAWASRRRKLRPPRP